MCLKDKNPPNGNLAKEEWRAYVGSDLPMSRFARRNSECSKFKTFGFLPVLRILVANQIQMSVDPIIDLSFSTDPDRKEVEVIDPWKFLLLYTLSLGFYSIWWIYNHWRFFKERESSDIMPVWRAIFSIFFIYGLFERMLIFARKNNPSTYAYSSGFLAGIYIVLNLLSRLPDPYWMIAFGSAFCFVQPIQAFNSALDNSKEYRAKQTPGLSAGQVVIVILGSIFWFLMLLGLFMPEEAEY